MYTLGNTARDRITGFTGVLTARIVYLTGCTQYLLTPTTLDNEGKVRESHYFDEGRLDIVDQQPVVTLRREAAAGCDLPLPAVR